MSDRRAWASFFLLSLVWGTSFLFIKLALRSLTPLTLVALRLLVGWVGMVAIVRWRGATLPRDRATWAHLVLVAGLNTAVPFVLIAWAQAGDNGIDSGLAAVLNSAVPLFTILLAVLVVRSERFTAGRGLGLVAGFAGVLVLFGRELTANTLAISRAELLPLLAMLGGTLCYAGGAIYARQKLQHVAPVVMAMVTLGAADVMVWFAAAPEAIADGVSLPPLTVVSLLWLGLAGSCLGYILYYTLLQDWGSTRATLVTYVIPVVGVAAGALFLAEPVDWRLVVGGGLILSGVWTVNWRPRRRLRPAG